MKVPGFLIDYIVIDPEQMTNRAEKYNPAYTEEIYLTEDQIAAHCKHLVELSAGFWCAAPSGGLGGGAPGGHGIDARCHRETSAWGIPNMVASVAAPGTGSG